MTPTRGVPLHSLLFKADRNSAIYGIVRCPFRVKSLNQGLKLRRPLYPRKRTSIRAR